MSDNEPRRRTPTFEERTVPLDALYLDPSNTRFANGSDDSVSDDVVIRPSVQAHLMRRLLDGTNDGSNDLVQSLRAHGWLPLERVIVRSIGSDRYVVVDGNRRVAALKYLQREHESTLPLPELQTLGRLDPALFDAVPIVLSRETDLSQELLLKGLRHVAGPRPWPLLDQARWLSRMHDSQTMSTRELARSAGMTASHVSSLIRAARLAGLFDMGIFSDQSLRSVFPLLLEVVRSPELMEWLEWFGDEAVPRRQDNLRRLFRWLSSTFEFDSGEDLSGEPALTKRADIRELAQLVDDPRALAELDRTRRLSHARAISIVYAARVAEEVLTSSEAVMERLSAVASQLDADQQRRVELLSTLLRNAADAAQRRLPLTVQDAEAWLPPFNPSVSAHFSEVTVARYRGLRDVALPSLQRINVFAGLNNSGKTTLLEAVHLLAHQHDVTGALEVVRRRGRVESRVDPRLLVEQIPRTARLSGRFDAIAANETAVALDFARRPDVEEAAFYLGTLSLEATYAGRTQRSETLFYENRDRSTRNHGRNVLCRSALQSPFSLQDPSLLGQAYTRSVERLARDRIVSFLRDHIDGDLVSIDLVDRFQRFLVAHKGLEAPLDLTHFGDGMQRVFLMCLLVAFVENGVLLLDEFENAIHASLLPGLARFVHELAKEFEVQVFLTTHSDEAIEALVDADLGEAVSAYALVRGDGGITARHFPGTTLAELIDFAGFDLRSVK